MYNPEHNVPSLEHSSLCEDCIPQAAVLPWTQIKLFPFLLKRTEKKRKEGRGAEGREKRGGEKRGEEKREKREEKVLGHLYSSVGYTTGS